MNYRQYYMSEWRLFMKSKIAKRVIDILTALSAIFLIIFVAFITNTILSDLEDANKKNQFSDFHYAYLESRFYDMYLMTVENKIRTGELYQDTSQYELFSECFYYMISYDETNDETYKEACEETYEKIEWEFLKDKLNELSLKMNEE